ncbi:MAG: PQQ-binding-like beta-propeller repeat protein [Thermomicrobiales bacterium]
MDSVASRFRMPITLTLLAALVAAALVGTVGSAQEQEETQIAASPVPLGSAVPPEIADFANDWPAPHGDLAATRDAKDSAIDSSNVADLDVAWTFEVEATGAFGGMTSPPLVVGDTVYVQDMQSNVFALDRATGEVKWEKRYDIGTVGPNGLAAGYGRIVGTIGDTAEVFALDADSGAEFWRVKLSNNVGEGVDMAPLVHNNFVYVSTVPGNNIAFYRGGQKGIFYALDASSGHTVWQFDTTTDNLWGNARTNSGGGLWYPPSVDEDGNIYFGVGNAAPWPGNSEFPNASSRPGPNDYASSMVSLDPETGSLRWYYNAKPHDLFDLDFQLTPVLVDAEIDGATVPLAIGAGKTGTVVAANRETGEVVWEVPVGIHQNDDLQEIPEGETVEVYPGVLGGVETPMAYADGVLFVPVVNLPGSYTSTGFDGASLDLSRGTGELAALNVADGSTTWQVDLPQAVFSGVAVANDVVFTATLDGVIRAVSAETGEELWTYQAGSGVNAPPTVAGDMLIVPAAGFLIPPAGAEEEAATPEASPAEEAPVNQVIAFRLPGGDGVAATPAAAETEAVTEEATPAEVDEGGTLAAVAATGEVVVDIAQLAYNPVDIEVAAGTTVTWTNSDIVEHTVTHTPESGDPLFASDLFGPGESWRYTFETPGAYEYFCIPHPFMVGRVIVT